MTRSLITVLCFGGAGVERLLKAGDKISHCCAALWWGGVGRLSKADDKISHCCAVLGVGVERKVVEGRLQA